MSRAYYVWTIGGLLAATAIIVAVAAATEDVSGTAVVPVAVAVLGVYFAGIFAFAFAQMRRTRRDLTSPHPELVGQEIEDAGRIEEFSELMAAMATENYDPEAIRRAGGTGFSIGRSFLVFGVVIIATGLALPLASLGSGSIDIDPVWPGAVVVAAVLFFGAFVINSLRRAGGVADEMLAPLGLRVTAVPEIALGPSSRTSVSGATVLGGKRHGREVEVAMGASEHLTAVATEAPAFKIEQEDGRLRASEGAPAAVNRVLDGLSDSKRWRKLDRIEGGKEGIVAVRKIDPESGWLWDLWLCERLAEAL